MADRKQELANVVTGTLLGALVGGGMGLGVCIYIFDQTPFFVGDTVLIGALVCGVLGYWQGERFIEWLSENWWWFW